MQDAGGGNGGVDWSTWEVEPDEGDDDDCPYWYEGDGDADEQRARYDEECEDGEDFCNVQNNEGGTVKENFTVDADDHRRVAVGSGGERKSFECENVGGVSAKDGGECENDAGDCGGVASFVGVGADQAQVVVRGGGDGGGRRVMEVEDELERLGLDERERLFVFRLAEGMHYVKAYLEAGYNDTGNAASVQVCASRKRNEKRLMDAVRILQRAVFGPNMLTVEEKRSLLADIARGMPSQPDSGQMLLFAEPPSHRERISAIEADNRMAGDNAPEEHLFVSDIFKGL